MGQTMRRVYIAGVLLSMFAFSAGCGSGRQARPEAEAGDVDIDALLAEENKDQQRADEEEVLRLLGITPSTETTKPTEKKETTPVTTAETATQEPEAMAAETPTDARLEDLKQQLAQLEQQLETKDETIEKLREELQQREAQLAQLKMQTQAPSARGNAVGLGAAGAVSGDYKARYQRALETYYARRYREAIQMFRALLDEDDRNPLADNAQYWIGECYYGLGNYTQAIAEFEKVFAFPNSNKADDAQLKLGVTYLRLGNRARAREEFERLIANYPNSEYVSTARRYLSKLQG
jgi:tol-pal system protein YbgF